MLNRHTSLNIFQFAIVRACISDEQFVTLREYYGDITAQKLSKST